MSDKVKIKALAKMLAEGQHCEAGDEATVSAATAALLVGLGRAEYVEGAPVESATSEPAGETTTSKPRRRKAKK